MSAAKFEKLAAQVRKASSAALEAVGELRGKIDGIKAELAALRERPCSRAEVEGRARELVKALAGHGSPIGSVLIDANPPFPAAVLSRAAVGLRAASAAELLAAYFPEAFVAGLLAEAERAAEASGGWGEAGGETRQAELERLAAELLALEHQEEALIMTAGELGIAIARRPDADPRAVLGLDRPALTGPPAMRDDELSEIPAAG